MGRVFMGGKIIDTDLLERVEIRTSGSIRFLYVEVIDFTNTNTGKQNLCLVDKPEDYSYIKRFMEDAEEEYGSFDGMGNRTREEMHLYGLYLMPFVNCSMMFDYFVNNCLFLVPSIDDVYSKIEKAL